MITFVPILNHFNEFISFDDGKLVCEEDEWKTFAKVFERDNNNHFVEKKHNNK